MDIEKVYEFSAGKNDWNTFEIGVKDDTIVVRDDVGMVQFVEEDIDKLIDGIDQARRHLREKQRRPTKPVDAQDEPEPEEPEPVEEPDTTDESDEDDQDDDGIQSTGLGPQFPGSDSNM